VVSFLPFKRFLPFLISSDCGLGELNKVLWKELTKNDGEGLVGLGWKPKQNSNLHYGLHSLGL
jgi:hypothetical protein